MLSWQFKHQQLREKWLREDHVLQYCSNRRIVAAEDCVAGVENAVDKDEEREEEALRLLVHRLGGSCCALRPSLLRAEFRPGLDG